MPNKVNAADQPSYEKGKEPAADWTMLVYLAGDNNLTSEMVWALQELKKTSIEKHLGEHNINIVAHFDPGGLRSRRYDIVEASGPKGTAAIPDGTLDEAVVYTQRFVEKEIDEHKSLKNLGEPGRTITAFVMSQIRELPKAKRFIVVLSGHGSGAEGDFLMDSDPTTSLSIPELGLILREAVRIYHKKELDWHAKPADRIQILGMDSCLMSNVEVCYEIRDSVNYLVASEGFVENTGWPYHRVAEALLARNPTEDESFTVAKTIATLYTKFYRDFEISGDSTDIAVCNLEAFRKHDGLVGELEKLAAFLIPKLEASHARRVAAMAQTAPKDLKKKIEDLAEEIAKLVPKKGLAESLRKGSERAKEMLADEAALKKADLSDSAKTALQELMQTERHDYKQEKKKITEIPKDVLWPEPNKQNEPERALAIVRAIRELDPGVQEALKYIETKLDPLGHPDAKRARKLLLLFHHMRQVTELHDLNVDPGDPFDVQFLNALSAARWDAQSFKGGVYVDLFDFCERLEKSHTPGLPDLKTLKNSIRSEFSKPYEAVVHALTTGPTFQHAHGLSVFLPVAAEDYTLKYTNLQFAKRTGWARLARAYLEATRKPRRDEDRSWFGEEPIRRYQTSEVDPLRREEIEARIIGVEKLETSGAAVDKQGRGGGDNSAKGGGDNSAKGKMAAVFGNQPDGFRRL